VTILITVTAARMLLTALFPAIVILFLITVGLRMIIPFAVAAHLTRLVVPVLVTGVVCRTRPRFVRHEAATGRLVSTAISVVVVAVAVVTVRAPIVIAAAVVIFVAAIIVVSNRIHAIFSGMVAQARVMSANELGLLLLMLWLVPYRIPLTMIMLLLGLLSFVTLTGVMITVAGRASCRSRRQCLLLRQCDLIERLLGGDGAIR
jgi:hypothetical protein